MDKRILRSMPAIPEIRGAVDNFILCDLPGLASVAAESKESAFDSPDWLGMSYDQSLQCVRTGNLAGVAASDAFMTRLEGLTFVAPKYRTIDDVVGSAPNIPNFIAGVPCQMRRRVRQSSAVAPIAIFAELSSHATLGVPELTARGSAILALVRLLSNIRPVELWAGATLGGSGVANFLYCRIETAPLDLARAAHVLSSPSVARGLMYGSLCHAFGYKGGAAYGNVSLERKYSTQILSRVISPGSDVLYIPTAWNDDPTISNPVAWIESNINAHGGKTVAAA